MSGSVWLKPVVRPDTSFECPWVAVKSANHIITAPLRSSSTMSVPCAAKYSPLGTTRGVGGNLVVRRAILPPINWPKKTPNRVTRKTTSSARKHKGGMLHIGAPASAPAGPKRKPPKSPPVSAPKTALQTSLLKTNTCKIGEPSLGEASTNAAPAHARSDRPRHPLPMVAAGEHRREYSNSGR
jgi:hypothetical protein